MRFSAHPSLLEGAHNAALDEIRHARSAFDLAARFNLEAKGDAQTAQLKVEVGEFPESQLQLTSNLSMLASRTFEEGCIGKSSATSRLAYAIASLQEGSPAKSVMQQLLRDEARHAALAWATVLWARQRGAIFQALPREESLGSLELAEQDISKSPLLKWAGRIPESSEAHINALVNEVWVKPWWASVSQDSEVSQHLEVPDDGFGKAVAEAAHLVHKELKKFSFLSGREVSSSV